MVKREILIFIAFVAFVLASEVEDAEQKKRGAGKANALNAIPTGAQKPEYTYNIYSQNPSAQNNPSQNYQSQISNSFYPNQVASQYYASNSGESSSSNPSQQVNNIPQTTSHFVPITFVPNSGYQQKYQIIPSKQSNNIQIATLQQPNIYPTSSILQYPQMVLASNPTNHVAAAHAPIFHTPQNHFNFPHYPLSNFGQPLLTHPSSMFFVPQINPNIFGNLAYTSPSQGVLNYYQPQPKQSYTPVSSSAISSNEYDKLHGAVSQSSGAKEDGELNVQNQYISSDSNNAYKNSYNTGRGTYTKI